MRPLILACALLFVSAGVAAAQASRDPASLTRSSPTGPRIVGGPGVGCIAGAVELPADGPGYQTIRASRSWFWGHPDTVTALQGLGRQAQAAGLPKLYMNDLSRPRGGPMAGLHASHQIGLDADVWLDMAPKPALDAAARDAVEVVSLVAPDVWPALQAADVVLVPSRVEPFGNAAVEAMLAGRPVVASQAQGLREIVRPGENGELAEPGDAGSLADAIGRIIDDWPAAAARADAARQEAITRYSPDRYRERIAAATARVAR